MNSSIFISNILEPLNQYTANLQAKKSRRRFWLHFDNASCHRSKVVKNYMGLKKFSRALHPPFSHDLAPSDFYLFGKVKNKTQGVHFQDEEELLLTIQSEFEEIPRELNVANYAFNIKVITSNKQIYYYTYIFYLFIR